MTENQYPEMTEALEFEIESAKTQLEAGGRASDIANELQSKGLSDLNTLVVVREATGAGMGDLKSFGRWWSEHGVTDAEALDEWADKVFQRR